MPATARDRLSRAAVAHACQRATTAEPCTARTPVTTETSAVGRQRPDHLQGPFPSAPAGAQEPLPAYFEPAAPSGAPVVKPLWLARLDAAGHRTSAVTR